METEKKKELDPSWLWAGIVILGLIVWGLYSTKEAQIDKLEQSAKLFEEQYHEALVNGEQDVRYEKKTEEFMQRDINALCNELQDLDHTIAGLYNKILHDREEAFDEYQFHGCTRTAYRATA